MRTIKNLITTTGLLGSGIAWSHGVHAEAPTNSLLHLLAHSWPVILGGIALIAVFRWIRKTH